MKNIKDVIIGVFAVIGFAAIVTGFTSIKDEETQQNPTILTSPESHIWEFSDLEEGRGTAKSAIYIINKKTGEVRYYKNEKRQ